MFFILGISISIFLGILLLIKRDKSSADYILVAWLLYIAIHQLFFYLLSTEALYNYPHLLGIEIPMPLLQGIFLYFYVLTITGKQLKKKSYFILHLIPTIILVSLLIPFYSLSGAEKVKVFQSEGVGYEHIGIIANTMIPIMGLIYSIWSFFLIKQHQKAIRDNLSNIDKKELQWLKYLTIGLTLIWLLAAFFPDYIIFTGVVIFVLFIGFFGINQMDIFQSNSLLPANIDETEILEPNTKVKSRNLSVSTAKRYAKSGVTDHMSTEIYSKLNMLMTEESLYNQNNITLTDLAKRLKVHPNHLSQVINVKEQKNFYQYINALRIKEFIRIASLPESKKYTLLSLAYQCGFNSKSTFNKHFKNNTGKTPTEYFKFQTIDN